MEESQPKPQNLQQNLQLQRMQQEMKIQKLQQELEQRKQQQAKLQEMLNLQQGAAVKLPDPAASPSLSTFASHGTPSVKALPVDAMMQTLRSRMGGAGPRPTSSLFPELGLSLNTKLDSFGLGTTDPLLSQSLNTASQAQQQSKNTNKHTINITVKRKTKVDVPGLPISLQKLNKVQPQANPKPASQPSPGGISPELLSMLDALRAGNAVTSAATGASPAGNAAVVAAPQPAAPQTQQMTIGALTGAHTVPQMANPMTNMIKAAQAVHNQQTQAGAVSGNMLATAVTASKASNTMADIVDTQMDAMADMAEAGMGFGMMNMMSMGGMNMMGSGMGMGGMGLGSGLGGLGMGSGMGMSGLGMNRMMSSTFMSPMGLF